MSEKKLILSKKEIDDRVKELGRSISDDYTGKDLVIVGILNGAFVFMADLIRQINLPLELDFVRLASYGSSSSAGELRFIKDIEIPIANKDVLIIEDIVDTGHTITYLLKYLTSHSPRSIRICTLIDKNERREVAVHIDYVGFTINKGFLVGYGLDYAEQYRHLPAIYHIQLQQSNDEHSNDE